MTHSPRGVRRVRTSVSAPEESADTLVAVLANDHDLNYFIRNRSYRIPDRALGRSLARDALEGTKYLALYQSSGVTEGLPGAIEWWGKISGIRSLRRREIFPEEPDHPSADELYHVITVGRRRRRRPPLRSRRPRRIIFIRTTRRRFLSAEDISDLPLGSPPSETLVEAVAERVAAVPGIGMVPLDGKTFMKIRDVGMEVDVDIVEGEPSEFPGAEGRVAEGDVHPGGSQRIGIIRFSAARVETDIESCVDQIMDALARIHTPPGGKEP